VELTVKPPIIADWAIGVKHTAVVHGSAARAGERCD
jgi:hypothetical protein